MIIIPVCSKAVLSLAVNMEMQSFWPNVPTEAGAILPFTHNRQRQCRFSTGVKDLQMILVIRTENGMEAILKDQFKAGAEAGVVIGTKGGSIEGASTTNMGADILAFSLDRGFFGGAALDGSVFAKRADLNTAFYGQNIEPRAIVIEGNAANPAADSLDRHFRLWPRVK